MGKTIMGKCVCCNAKRISKHYFMLEDGSESRVTRDHIVLHSLGGKNTIENISIMCHRCNQLRGNRFAEQKEFIDWFHSGNKQLPKQNYSYITGLGKLNRSKYDYSVSVSDVNIMVLNPENKSTIIRVYEKDGVMYKECRHPLFGTSVVKA